MAKRGRAYFGLPWLISVILAIFPTNVLFGIITRLLRGNILGVLLNIIIAPVFYIIDLVTIILYKDITVLA
jgi:hypothetical protein